MSVAAMTMDDQRPLMNTYDKMSKQYEQSLHSGGVGGGGSGGAPPSGPASPTPSGPEEPPASQHAQYHHSHHHHHSTHATASHHHHQHHQSQYHHRHQHAVALLAEQQSVSSPAMSPQQQQQSQQQQQVTQHQPQQQQQQQLDQQQQQSLSTANTAAAVAAVEQRQRLLEEEIDNLKSEQTRLSQQCADAQRREKILMRRLANKEQEFQDYVSQIAEYKAAQAPSAVALRSALLDPAVNLLFEKLKKELKATKAKLEETQNELSAWKFTPDSNTGKRLMAKCRLLYQENEELGKMTSSGRLAKLETELAMQKSFREEVKKSQSELDDFLQELDEDVEGMQSTILYLQQELKTTRERIQILEKENYQLKNGDATQEAANEDLPSETDNAQLSLNGNANGNEVKPIMYNNLPSQQQSTTTISTISSNTLETIDENETLRITNASQHTVVVTATGNEFYNGNVTSEEQQQQQLDDGSNGSSNNSANGGKFRTAASRKRTYDSDSNETIAIVTPTPASAASATSVTTTGTVNAINAMPPTTTVVSTPRTLPPKKSKLRVTPVRRASAQSADVNDHELGNVGTDLTLSGVGVGVGMVVDNAVAGMANEEITGGMPSDELDSNNGGLAQRIITRRRSVRTQQQQQQQQLQQQNGNGTDSNH